MNFTMLVVFETIHFAVETIWESTDKYNYLHFELFDLFNINIIVARIYCKKKKTYTDTYC